MPSRPEEEPPLRIPEETARFVDRDGVGGRRLLGEPDLESRARFPFEAGPRLLEDRLERGAVPGRDGDVDAADARGVPHGRRRFDEVLLERRPHGPGIPMEREEALRKGEERLEVAGVENAKDDAFSRKRRTSG